MKIALVACFLLAAGASSAQPAFPHVDPAVQAARDDDRMRILMQERETETTALQAAEKGLASAGAEDKGRRAEDVERHRKNLIALDAEIQRAAGAASAAVVKAHPVRLKAASAAPDQAAASREVPYWDVYRRKQDN